MRQNLMQKKVKKHLKNFLKKVLKKCWHDTIVCVKINLVHGSGLKIKKVHWKVNNKYPLRETKR